MEGLYPLGSKILLDTKVRGTAEGSGRGQSWSTEGDKEASEPLRSEEAAQVLGSASCFPGRDGVWVPDPIGTDKIKDLYVSNMDPPDMPTTLEETAKP